MPPRTAPRTLPLLGLHGEDVEGARNRSGLEGIQRSYLEERLHQLLEGEDWPAIMDVYRLLVYKIVLIPHSEDYIDMVAKDVFLAKRDKGENHVIVVLANTYCTLNYYYDRNGKSLK
ncbi:hypothetical protein CR513_14922, partial [Mucuna pruriens]